MFSYNRKNLEDEYTWSFETLGKYSTRSMYRALILEEYLIEERLNYENKQSQAMKRVFMWLVF